jgi:signal transduction histidine kinase
LIKARQDAEKASTAKSEFLAKISHEIRTPLNAIIGFSEVMMDERFGPIGNDRYRQYLRDIHTSGEHLISLLNDLLDLSKIEAGKLDLTFVTLNLNDIVQQCVAIMQEEANRQRVIVRTALNAKLPPVVADARSVRQIALNILSNSIKFTGAGGQVIVSTAVNDEHEVSLRVRDTGVGMSERELQTALEPFRQLATTSRWGTSGTGLGLPITKALAEANHARFRISSEVDAGTLVEVAFPATRVLAS